jgi:sterol 3beta-glucosyltransferase
MVASVGVGPPPLAIGTLTAQTLVKAIEKLLAPITLEAAAVLSQKMQQENGVKEAVNSFHRNLPHKKLNCDFIPNLPAVWTFKKDKRTFKLSFTAAKVLIERGRVNEKGLKL